VKQRAYFTLNAPKTIKLQFEAEKEVQVYLSPFDEEVSEKSYIWQGRGSIEVQVDDPVFKPQGNYYIGF